MVYNEHDLAIALTRMLEHPRYYSAAERRDLIKQAARLLYSHSGRPLIDVIPTVSDARAEQDRGL